MAKMVSKLIKKAKRLFGRFLNKTFAFVNRRPFLSFFVLLGIFFFLIVVSNLLRQTPVAEETVKKEPKKISLYQIGEAPKIKMQAQIEKSGVLQIAALTGGIVQRIYISEGQVVSKGMTLVGISSSYQGGNVLSVQRQIVQKQLENLQETMPWQKDLIGKQKEIVNKTDANSDALRDLTNQSVASTSSLISLNNDILNSLNINLNQYNATNSAGVNDSLILSTKQLLSQFQSANNQLSQALSNAQYQAGSGNNPAQLSDLQRDLTLRQLDIQEKSLDLNLEITKLQLQAARIAESTSFPSAPFTSTVQRVFVREGQLVQPGTPLLTLAQRAQDDPIVAVVYAPLEVARKVSVFEESELFINKFNYTAYPTFISEEAVQGNLYAIYYSVPDNYSKYLTDKAFIEVQIPIGVSSTTSVVPVLPLEAIFSTQNSDFVFLMKNGQAQAKEIELGEVVGSFVVVEKGLEKGDQVILDRNVLSGDQVIPL